MNLLNINTQSLKWLCAGVMFLLTLASVCMPLTDSWANQTTTIRFTERVEIDGAEILLGQIASFEGDDVQLIQQLKNIVIGKAPLPGESRPFGLRKESACGCPPTGHLTIWDRPITESSSHSLQLSLIVSGLRTCTSWTAWRLDSMNSVNQ